MGIVTTRFSWDRWESHGNGNRNTGLPAYGNGDTDTGMEYNNGNGNELSKLNGNQLLFVQNACGVFAPLPHSAFSDRRGQLIRS